ncbi:MAG TPA: DUF4440 domain-containing protein [Gemmatimonadaceae bacterium]|jgi:uncharacterized protein (TIGR02246 family)
MSRSSRVLSCTAALLIAGCASRVDTARESQALLETDRAWARQSSAGTNADSVIAYWTDDARVVVPGAAVLDGKDAIRRMVTSSFAAPGFHVAWTPERAVVAASGDLGYTVGTNEFSIPDSTGHVSKVAGNYITVWRKGKDGRWRCAEDYSSPGPAHA